MKTTIEDGVSIGAAAVIVAGITIGRYAMIGAGSVVTKNIPPYTLWYGNPAKMKKFICACSQILNKSFACSICGKKYLEKNSGGLEEIK